MDTPPENPPSVPESIPSAGQVPGSTPRQAPGQAPFYIPPPRDPSAAARAWVAIIGLLVIFAVAVFGMLWIVQDTVQRTVKPVQDTAGGIGTAVAQVLYPSPTVLPDPVTIIRGVRSLARLETIQFSVEKVITAESGQGSLGFLFGDKLIFVAHGDVLAGVDMQKLQPEDLHVENGVLFVRLPEPEVFLSRLDSSKSRVYSRETGLLTKGDLNLESTARQAAEEEIQKAAVEDGILKMARANAENYLYRLFRNAGYEEVIFEPPATPTPGP